MRVGKIIVAREIRVRDRKVDLSAKTNAKCLISPITEHFDPARPTGLRYELLDQMERMRVRWKALDEHESMCGSVVLETVFFVPKFAGQTRALSWRKDTVQKEKHCAPLFEELHAVHVVELFLIVEWGGMGVRWDFAASSGRCRRIICHVSCRENPTKDTTTHASHRMERMGGVLRSMNQSSFVGLWQEA